MRTRSRTARLASARLVVAASVLAAAVPVAGRAEDAEPINERLRRRIEAMLLTDEHVAQDRTLHALEPTRQLYTRRAFEPIWSDPAGGNARLDTLLAILREDERFGLPACVYHVDTLAALAAVDAPTRGARVDLELLASDAALVHASHVALGRVSPETFDPEWFAVRRELDAVTMLAAAVEGDSLGRAFRALHPDYPGYRRLAAAYDALRIAPEDSLPAPEDGPAVRAGDDIARTSPVAWRLRALGDLPAAADGDSAALDAAIRRFQARHGLDADGAVGRFTRRWLWLESAQVARTLALNLERWRWLPAELGERHVRVNIAGFTLELVEDHHRVARVERVVVGQAYRRTPVFSASMRYVVLNPSWEVPPGILAKDLVPAVKADPSLLERRGMTILAGWGADERVVDPASIDWETVRPRGFPYRIRQRPGPTNPLGTVKLIFPNRFDVYIHDTIDRSLFARSTRTMSSGCVRVDHPLAVTAWALADSARWSVERLEEAVASGEERTVPLRRPLPVHVLYWTAWVDEEGELNLRQDVYGRDARLEAALAVVEACE